MEILQHFLSFFASKDKCDLCGRKSWDVVEAHAVDCMGKESFLNFSLICLKHAEEFSSSASDTENEGSSSKDSRPRCAICGIPANGHIIRSYKGWLPNPVCRTSRFHWKKTFDSWKICIAFCSDAHRDQAIISSPAIKDKKTTEPQNRKIFIYQIGLYSDQKREADDEFYRCFNPEIRAASEVMADIVVELLYRRELVGHYERTNDPAYVIACSVRVIDNMKKHVISEKKFYGSHPPEKISGFSKQGFTGEAPHYWNICKYLKPLLERMLSGQ